jgi:hypothetical protein
MMFVAKPASKITMVTPTIIRLLIACLSPNFKHSGRSLAGSQLSADGRDYFRMNSHCRTAFGDATEHNQVRQWIMNQMLVSVPLWVIRRRDPN